MRQQLSLSARPRRFRDLIGQKTVVDELAAYYDENKDLPVALLLGGPSGTGKTSTARLCAVALECSHGESFEDLPCRDCMRAYLFPDRYESPEDFAVDITEINCADAGIDQIRQSLSGVNHAPGAGANFRNYILDEFQDLPKKAQKLLNKIMEDSPASSKFYLCAMEPDSLIASIKNRCIPYAFRTLKPDEIALLVERLLTRRKSDLDPILLSDLLDEHDINSPRAITQAITKYLSGATPEQAISLLGEGELDIARVCRWVYKGDWESLSKVLQEMDADQARQCRQRTVGYFKTVLLEESSPDKRALASKAIVRMVNTFTVDTSMAVAALGAGLYDVSMMFNED
jgi:DNA polymerase III gamma/tau subunit